MLVMTGFEFFKDVFFANLSPWTSHALTIVFTAALSGLVMFITSRLYVRILRQTIEETAARMRVMKELGHERNFMRALMEYTPDRIYFKDKKSRFIRINNATAKDFGLSHPREAVNKTDADFFGEDHASRTRKAEEDIIGTGEMMVALEEKEVWRDGRVSWVSSTKVPLRDRRGQIIGTFGISRDITDRLQRDMRTRQLSRAVEQSPVMVVVTDAEARIEYVNPEFCRITGYPAEDAQGQNISILNSGKTPPGVMENLWATIRAGKNWAGEFLNRRKNGELFWCRSAISALTDDQGQIARYVAVMEDVTDEKLSTEALKEAFRRREDLERIISQSPVVLFLWRNAAGWPVEFVSANVSMFGYTPDDLTSGRVSYAEIVHPDDLPRVAREVAEHGAKNDDEFVQSYRIKTQRGDYRWIEDRTNIRRDEQGKITHYQGIVLDITTRRAAEDANRKLTEGLRTILDATDELMACETVDEIWRRAVELTRERFGLERSGIVILESGRLRNTYGTDLAGETTDERSHNFELNPRWSERSRMRSPQESRWQAEIEDLYEWDGRGFQGVGRKSAIVTTPIQTADRVLGVFCNDYGISGRDVDEGTQDVVAVFCSVLATVVSRKQAESDAHRQEAEKRRAIEEADRLNSLGILAAGMAHEVNNPLQGMLTHLHIATRKIPAASPSIENLKMVEKGIETISALVRKLLTLGSSQEGGSEDAECGEVIQFVTQLFEGQFQRAQIALRVENGCPTAKLAMPRREMIQVLMNLLINARDAMPAGGEIRLNCAKELDGVQVRIQDGGTGISPEVLTHIFSPFFTTKGAKGTGLGLSVAEALVRNCGGSIRVESTPGVGSVFSLSIPPAKGQGK